MTPDPRRILVVEHQADAPAGIVDEWIAARGASPDVWRPGREDPPTPDAYDMVVSLGSEHAVYDGPGWIAAEVEVLRAADRAGVPVLGICFGAQILATALGGGVARAERPEIGWVTVASDDPTRVPAGPWMSWHSDAFTVPAGATALARTDVCTHAYRAGGHLGVQFHPEATPEIVDGWIATGGAQLDRLGIDPDGLRRDCRRHAPAARAAALGLFDAFWADAAAASRAPAARSPRGDRAGSA